VPITCDCAPGLSPLIVRTLRQLGGPADK
jgi:hypothetical protein